MDEQDLLKRNTDCVYFLASPLTCRKGLECEYRHSEFARLNPRDCWYWLAGSCLNPTCTFRHPPLDGHIEASSESAIPHYECTIPVNKTNVPCYFYFNGFCNKGERCSFLHGPDDGKLASKPSQSASTVKDAAVLEKKMATGSDTGLTPIETQINTFETAPKGATEAQTMAKQDLHQLVPTDVAGVSVSPQMSAYESEEATASMSESLLPIEGFIQSRSLVPCDQSSEERIEFSSPGFDVLVDNRLEDFFYEDDPDYVAALDMESRELNDQFMGYEYEGRPEYDPAYSDAGIFNEQIHDSCDDIGNAHTSDYTRITPEHSRHTVFDRIMPQKRKLLRVELPFHGRPGVDLRNHIKKHRLNDSHSVTHFYKRHLSSRLKGQGWKRKPPRSRGYHGRLASNVEKNIDGSSNEDGIYLKLRRPHINQSRERFERYGKQRFISSEISRSSALNTRRSVEESSMFTGPKTLDQLKEEKKKAHENGDSFGTMRHSGRTSSQDFRAPKPLSEILEDKRRLVLVISRHNGSS